MRLRIYTTCLACLLVATVLYSDLLQTLLPLPASLRVFDLLIVGWLFTLCVQSMRLPRERSTQRIHLWLVFFVLMSLVLPAIGSAVSHYSLGTTIKGWGVPLRIAMYGSLFWIAYTEAVSERLSVRAILGFTLLASAGHLYYALLQYAALNLNLIPYHSLWWQPTRTTADGLEEVVNYAPTALTGAPFNLADIGGQIAIISLAALILVSGTSRHNLLRRTVLLVTAACGVCSGITMVFLSYRRTGLLATIAALLVMYVATLVAQPLRIYRRAAIAAGLLVLLVSVPVLLTVIQRSESLAMRMQSFTALLEGRTDDTSLMTMQARVDVTWGYWVDYIARHPFGIGLFPPAIEKVASDNAYLVYLTQGSFLYLACYLGVLIALVLFGGHLLKRGSAQIAPLGLLVIGIVIYTVIAGLGTGETMGSELWILRWMLIGAVAGTYEATKGQLSKREEGRNKMVVLFITSLEYGGAETQVVRFAIQLQAEGWHPRVVSMLPPDALTDELDAAGIPHCNLGMQPGKPDPRAIFRFAHLLRSWQPDVVHSHMVHANLFARLTRIICPMRVLVCTAHNIDEGGRWRELAYRMTDRLCDMTTNVSHAALERYVRIKAVGSQHCRMIPNGVDTSIFKPNSQARKQIRHELQLGTSFSWLAIGRMEDAKDYPTLLQAFALLCRQRSDAQLLILGQGSREAEIRKLASSLKVKNKVRFLGITSAIPNYLATADGYVMSSAWEGLPMVLLEAAAVGIPIVATDVGGNREVVIDGVNGQLVPPRDPRQLMEAMLSIMSLAPATRAEMGSQGRVLVEEHYSLERITARYLDLYQELLERKRVTVSV